MGKSFKVEWSLLLIFLFTCSTVPFGLVKADLCSEDMGGCDPECKTRCEEKHPGAQSSCDAATSICKCFYECGEPTPPPPPKGKECNVGIGPCSARCYDDCCNQKCADKFPGDLGGHGYCNNPIGIYSACICYFRC